MCQCFFESVTDAFVRINGNAERCALLPLAHILVELAALGPISDIERALFEVIFRGHGMANFQSQTGRFFTTMFVPLAQ